MKHTLRRTALMNKCPENFISNLLITLALFLFSSAAWSGEADVPIPRVVGPISGGVHGLPWGVAARDPEDFGYVDEEYFISGTARAANGDMAEYTTRILVMRPSDPDHYRGTVLMEWLNVTSQMDQAPAWYASHEYLIREGYAFVAVSAQKAGIEGSPLALKSFDPVRYAPLNHPGDDYSFDIYSQAAQAVQLGMVASTRQPDPMGGLQPRRMIATGQSQSASRMRAYINDYPQLAGVFDGFLPIGSSVTALRDDLAPVLWLNSENEADGRVPRDDGGLFLLWEIAGAAHVGWWALEYGVASGMRNHAGEGSGNHFDRERAGQYGEKGSGPCPQDFMPDRFAYNAAIDHLEKWIKDGTMPPAAPRLKRAPLTAALVRDNDGNAQGGLRLPPMLVPVAAYTGNQCGLFGQTVAFDPVELERRYPTKAAYVSAMQQATDAVVKAGYMLPTDAEEMMQRVNDSSIGALPNPLP